MAEIRKDIITGDSVIISPERGKKPQDFKITENNPSEDIYKEDCPFCRGNEGQTPKEVLAYRTNHDDITDWSIRVVPNLYSALQKETAFEVLESDFYEKVSAAGSAEVLIEDGRHNVTLGQNDFDQVLRVLYAIKERIQELRNDERLKYINVFKNFGVSAGASKEHGHWQILSTPIIPNKVEKELEGAKKYFGKKRKCVYCEIIKNEINIQDRLIIDEDKFVAIAPYASKYAFETWIMPKRHFGNFDSCSHIEMSNLAKILKEVISKLENKLNYPPYNIVLHTIPIKMNEEKYYHWYLQICPKLFTEAGFEISSGININPTPPELAAQSLKEV